jgi:hypothetical protein
MCETLPIAVQELNKIQARERRVKMRNLRGNSADQTGTNTFAQRFLHEYGTRVL